MWGSLESWVRVRVTGSDGSLSGFRVLSGFGGGKVRSENYVRVRVTGGGVPKEEPDPNGSIDRRFLGPLGQLIAPLSLVVPFPGVTVVVLSLRFFLFTLLLST